MYSLGPELCPISKPNLIYTYFNSVANQQRLIIDQDLVALMNLLAHFLKEKGPGIAVFAKVIESFSLTDHIIYHED